MIHIDIDADLNMVDDADRNLARLPAGSRLKAGDVVAAGRPGFWSWVLVDEVAGGSVFFHQISGGEAAKRGELTVRPE